MVDEVQADLVQTVQLEAVEDYGDTLGGEAGPRVEVAEAVVGVEIWELEATVVGGVSREGAPGGLDLLGCG